ncbi:unnamed protein product, partial [Cuscuta epithymum]
MKDDAPNFNLLSQTDEGKELSEKEEIMINLTGSKRNTEGGPQKEKTTNNIEDGKEQAEGSGKEKDENKKQKMQSDQKTSEEADNEIWSQENSQFIRELVMNAEM